MFTYQPSVAVATRRYIGATARSRRSASQAAHGQTRRAAPSRERGALAAWQCGQICLERRQEIQRKRDLHMLTTVLSEWSKLGAAAREPQRAKQGGGLGCLRDVLGARARQRKTRSTKATIDGLATQNHLYAATSPVHPCGHGYSPAHSTRASLAWPCAAHHPPCARHDNAQQMRSQPRQRSHH